MKAANNIVIMLCAIHNLTFRAEDRLSYSDEKDCLADSVSVGSTPDYTCYTIHNSLYLVAVVLETKVTYHKNALAQLLGYYIRSCSNIWRSGVYILLTTQTMHIVVLTFISKETSDLW